MTAGAVDEELLNSYVEDLNLQEIEKNIEDMFPETEISFRDTFMSLVKGEIPLEKEYIIELAKQVLFAEVDRQQKIVVQILILVIVAAVFTNFIRVFQKDEISEIAFYTIYLLLFVILMKAFGELSELTAETVNRLLHFMRVLMPIYFFAVSLTSGSLTAAGVNELILFAVGASEMLVSYIVVPGISVYVMMVILNYLGSENRLSKFADLIKTVMGWMMKTLLGMVVAIQAIQGMLLPAIDSLKNSVLHKMVSAVPVLGNTLNSVTEAVLGTAVILKNAVGAAGLIFIFMICLTPVVRLAICTLIYKAVGAAVQPVAEKRLTECIGGVAEGVAMLLKAVGTVGIMFLVTLAMVISSVKS